MEILCVCIYIYEIYFIYTHTHTIYFFIEGLFTSDKIHLFEMHNSMIAIYFMTCSFISLIELVLISFPSAQVVLGGTRGSLAPVYQGLSTLLHTEVCVILSAGFSSS